MKKQVEEKNQLASVSRHLSDGEIWKNYCAEQKNYHARLLSKKDNEPIPPPISLVDMVHENQVNLAHRLMKEVFSITRYLSSRLDELNTYLPALSAYENARRAHMSSHQGTYDTFQNLVTQSELALDKSYEI